MHQQTINDLNNKLMGLEMKLKFQIYETLQARNQLNCEKEKNTYLEYKFNMAEVIVYKPHNLETILEEMKIHCVKRLEVFRVELYLLFISMYVIALFFICL